MKISKVEFWNSPMLWTIVLKTILKISRHAENHDKNFKACWNIVFKCITDFNACWNLVFNMHYKFQNILKWTIVLKTILKISRHVENHVKHFKECWNIVFKMHYRFQHVLKFSFQHALQISEHSEIFKMLFQDVFHTFQT